jgi:UDP-arabinose 4-epimerase
MSASILVTGGAGYVGSHACKALAAAGYRPICFDNLSTGNRYAVKWGPLIVADICDRGALTQAMVEHKSVAVMHFAASALVGESVVHPEIYYKNNVVGTLSVLDAMVAAGVCNLVFSSSCATYGVPDQIPIAESAPQIPINPYGYTKLVCEKMTLDYARAFPVRVAMLRYFNACGADQDLEIGEDRVIETHIIPRAILSMLGHVNDFEVCGSDFPTPDGTAIRDYVHVADIARAHVLALKSLDARGHNMAFNIGTGRGYSVLEVLETVAKIAGQEMPTVKGKRREGDPAVLVADPSLARKELGFTPTQSELNSIVETAWKWHVLRHGWLRR